jgi:outer membrane protein OmpA-like peptidoglycan-associated protein
MRVLRNLGVLGLACAMVMACTTIDPYTREEKTSNTAKGAAIGAAAGVAVGVIAGSTALKRKTAILVGAGVGALVGGAIGNYMDREEAELRAKLEGTGVQVVRTGPDNNHITLVMPGNVTFDFDSAELKPQFYDVLGSVSLVMQKYDQTLIEVAGHTDSTGTRNYNLGLSERRATSVASYLQAQGVSELRLMTVGVGPDRPIADNSTDAGRQLNRRVELTLIPVTA